MRFSIISFTENGRRLSERLRQSLTADGEEVFLYTKCSAVKESGEGEASVLRVVQPVGEWAGEQLKEKNVLLFLGACGIAVRSVAPHLTDKLHDSPVLVMDELGTYVIPLLSGHMGGANGIAKRIAEQTGAIPVITTATDLNRVFSVDLFAKKNGLTVLNKEGIARVSAKLLAGGEITIAAEPGHIHKGSCPPAQVRLVSYPPEQAADVVITAEAGSFAEALVLRPQEYVIGVGCRKGKEPEAVEEFIRQTLEEVRILPEQCHLLASVEKKKEEPAFLFFSRKYGIPFETYTAGELQEVEGEFHTSPFVKAAVGTDNVCERAAVKACGSGGILVYGKHARDGMTIAVARREWSVVFDEE